MSQRRLGVALLCAGLSLAVAAQITAAEEGRQLFDGSAPLVGRITGIEQALPVQATRCSNCHRAEASSAAAVTPVSTGAAATTVISSDTRRYGPALSAALLREPQPRRGGPASRYDVVALCRVLRNGIDPASVIIDRTMPRYDITYAQCDSLWAYLTEAKR